MTQIILCIAAHPDDEVLGCGGTLARHAAEGDTVHTLILADGESSRTQADGDAIAQRHAASEAAAHALGIHAPQCLALPDNRLDSMDMLDIIQQIELVIARIKPTIIYTHHGGDLNVDHRIAHEATLTACRPQPGSSVRTIYSFETPSSTEWASSSMSAPFLPTRFVNIAASWDAKSQALDAYKDEMRAFPHARSVQAVEALARWRGASVGYSFAEAFMVIRDMHA